MGLERLVGFDSNLQPKNGFWNRVRQIFVPGSYFVKGLSLDRRTLNELEPAVSHTYLALAGETLRLASYATLAYLLFKDITDLVH